MNRQKLFQMIEDEEQLRLLLQLQFLMAEPEPLTREEYENWKPDEKIKGLLKSAFLEPKKKLPEADPAFEQSLSESLASFLAARNQSLGDFARELGIKKEVVEDWLQEIHLPNQEQLEQLGTFLDLKKQLILRLLFESLTRNLARGLYLPRLAPGPKYWERFNQDIENLYQKYITSEKETDLDRLFEMISMEVKKILCWNGFRSRLYDPDDLVQEICYKVSQSIKNRTFPLNHHQMPHNAIHHWLQKVTKRFMVDVIRQDNAQKYSTKVMDELFEDLVPLWSNEIKDILEKRELDQAVNQLLNSLKPDEKDVYDLYIAGLKRREIAIRLQITEKKYDKMLQNIKDHFKKNLQEILTVF